MSNEEHQLCLVRRWAFRLLFMRGTSIACLCPKQRTPRPEPHIAPPNYFLVLELWNSRSFCISLGREAGPVSRPSGYDLVVPLVFGE